MHLLSQLAQESLILRHKREQDKETYKDHMIAGIKISITKDPKFKNSTVFCSICVCVCVCGIK